MSSVGGMYPMPRAAGLCWDGVLLNGLRELAGRPQCHEPPGPLGGPGFPLGLSDSLLVQPRGSEAASHLGTPPVSLSSRATLASSASSFSSLGGFMMPWSFWRCLATTCILMSFFISLFLCCEHRLSRMFREKKKASVSEKKLCWKTHCGLYENISVTKPGASRQSKLCLMLSCSVLKRILPISYDL